MSNKANARRASVWRKFKGAIKLEPNEPQAADGLAHIQYLFKKIRPFASTNDPITLNDVSVICENTTCAFQVFRNLEAYRPSERYETALIDAEADFLYLYRHLFEIKYPTKMGKKTDNREDILGRIFIRQTPYPESPCKQIWSEVFSIYSAKSRHRHMSIKRKSEEDAILTLYRADLQFLENVAFAQYRIYQYLFEYAYDRCHYYRVRTIFDPIEKKTRWKLYYTADHWLNHRQDEQKFLELAKEIDTRYRLPGPLRTTLALQLTRDVFLALEWFDGYRHFQGALSHLQSWGQFKRDSYSEKEAEIIIREFRKTFEAFESLQDGKPSNWEYKTERKLAAQALGHIQMLCRSTWGPDSPKVVEYFNLYRTNLKRLDNDAWEMLGMEVTEEEERKENQRRREVAERRKRRRQKAGREQVDHDRKDTRQEKKEEEDRESEQRKFEREQRREKLEEWERQQEEARQKAEERKEEEKRRQTAQQERQRQEERTKAEQMENEKRRREERERQQEEPRWKREEERERRKSKHLLLRAQLLWNWFENPGSTWIDKQDVIMCKSDLFTFFKWLQTRHAPPEARKRQQFENLLEVDFSTRSPRNTCLQIIRIYHPDQNVTGQREWKEIAEEITKARPHRKHN